MGLVSQEQVAQSKSKMKICVSCLNNTDQPGLKGKINIEDLCVHWLQHFVLQETENLTHSGLSNEAIKFYYIIFNNIERANVSRVGSEVQHYQRCSFFNFCSVILFVSASSQGYNLFISPGTTYKHDQLLSIKKNLIFCFTCTHTCMYCMEDNVPRNSIFH